MRDDMCVAPNESLCVVWTQADKEVAFNMAFMYARNSIPKGWWKRVRLVVWGPTAKLLSEDAELQDHLTDLTKAGVELMACKACADNYGVSDDLAGLGIEVLYVGHTLTEMLKDGWKVLTV